MNIHQGINPTLVDATATFPLGTEVDDPRVNDFPGNKIRYVKAGSTITLGDALKLKADEATLEPWVLIPTSAVAQTVVAIAHVTIASGSFGWVTSKGRVPSTNVGASIAAEAKLGTSSSAGKLIALAGVDSNFTSNIYNAIVAAASGITPIALDANDSNGAQIETFLP